MISSQLAEFAKHDLTRLAAFLNAPDIKTQTQALEEAVQVNLLLADAAVYALQTGQDRYFVAERLHSFGSVIVEPLQALLNESPDDEVQVLAALVLLRLGSKAGIPALLNAVSTEPPDRYASLIVERLAANGVSEASEAIMTRLRRFSPADVDLGKSFESNPNKDFVVTALHALQELGAALPEELARQFTMPSVPIEITSILASERKAAKSIAKTLLQEGKSIPPKKAVERVK